MAKLTTSLQQLAAKFAGEVNCSFCGKEKSENRRLIQGPGVYICEACVDLCREILSRDNSQGAPPNSR